MRPFPTPVILVEPFCCRSPQNYFFFGRLTTFTNFFLFDLDLDFGGKVLLDVTSLLPVLGDFFCLWARFFGRTLPVSFSFLLVRRLTVFFLQSDHMLEAIG